MQPVASSKTWIWVALLGVAACLAALSSRFIPFHDKFQTTLVAVAEIGGEFRLASARGSYVDTRELKGKPYGVFFGFTHCPEVCPTTLYEMSRSLEALGSAGNDFRLFFITVDPERDTAPKLRDYLMNFDQRIEALVPSPTELEQIARQFRVIYEKVPTSDGGYTMNHTATVFLFNRQGLLQSTISFNENNDARLKKLKRLMEF